MAITLPYPIFRIHLVEKETDENKNNLNDKKKNATAILDCKQK